MRLKVTLWADSTAELTRNLEAHGMNPSTVIAVFTGVYVKQYQGKFNLSSTSATKIYFHLDIPRSNILEKVPAPSGYSSADPSVAKARLTDGNQMGIWIQCTKQKSLPGKVIRIDTTKGWYYLGYNNCTTKLVGDSGDHWCPSCKTQIENLVPRYLLRLEVEDSTGSAFLLLRTLKFRKLSRHGRSIC